MEIAELGWCVPCSEWNTDFWLKAKSLLEKVEMMTSNETISALFSAGHWWNALPKYDPVIRCFYVIANFKFFFSSLLYPFPARVYFNPPKLKQSVSLPSAPALTVALIFMVPAGTAGVSCWNIAYHPHPINLQAAIFRGEWEVGRGCACEEANIPLSNLYFTFL